MAQTPNHGYNVPDQGATDWHVPLNENFEQYDTDIEVRDTQSNRGNYDPKQGAKFLATDTGRVYLGNGSSWQRLRTTGPSPSFDQLNPNGGFLGVGRSSAVTGSDAFGVQADRPDDSFGGMYVETTGSEGWPFYGYATDDTARMWHYYDHGEETWYLEFDQGDVRFPFMVSGDGFVGVGREEPVTPAEIFGVQADASSLEYGGMYVETTSSEGWPFYGYATDGSARGWSYYDGDDDTWNLAVDGSTVVTIDGDGNIDADGNKNFVQTVDTDDGEREVVYTATEAGTPHTEASGVARLEDGRAEVELPEHFAWVTSDEEPLVVQTTPYGGTAGLKVVEHSTRRLVVEDLDGAGDYEFAYTVTGTRAGQEDKEVVREPSASANAGNPPAPADD